MFSVEGGGFNNWMEKLQIFVFKPACKNDYEELHQGVERINVKRYKIESIIDGLFDDTFY
jgi:hypothetical protein